MIELAFGDSFAGTLKYAKSMSKGTQLNGSVAVAVIGGTRKENREAIKKARKPDVWKGETMNGNSSEVAALSLMPEMGDISDMDTGMASRRKLFAAFFADFPGASDEVCTANQQTIARLQKAAKTNEPVRMWICPENPGELCSLYFVCHLMLDSSNFLSVVRIPKEITQDNSIVNYCATGEINPELLGEFTKYEEPISELQRNIYANNWRILVQENAPLRVIVNGNLMSAPEYFYDFALRVNIPDGEIRIGQLIGKTLSQLSGVGDYWLFLRVQEMLRTGELLTVSEAAKGGSPYSAVIRKNVGYEK